MTHLTYDQFLNSLFTLDGLAPTAIAYRGTVPVLTTERALVHESIWCFVERDATGQWKIESQQAHELYLMVRWITSGWGRNTTGEGALNTEAEKDVLVPLCALLDQVCPTVTWSQARQLFRAVTTAALGEHGNYSETRGDGVLEEYEYTYAYQAVKLYPLYQWLIENGLL